MNITIEDQVRKVIKEHINQEIEIAVEKATGEMKRKIKEKLGVIAVSLAKHFNIRSGEHFITITYEEKDRK